MLVNIFSLYLQGLLAALLATGLYLTIWLSYRRLRKLDKTTLEQRAFWFDVLILGFISVPILSFAFMAILIMFKA